MYDKDEITWTKKQLKDTTGRPLTQSLFLELGYRTEYAVFTLNEEDKEYQGKIYPSLRRFYLASEDPTEYQFAKDCLLGWNHWIRITENKNITPHVQNWREEMEVALRSAGALATLNMATSDTSPNFQAAKWLADKGWDKNRVGRPSKQEQEREDRIGERIYNELNDNIVRMEKYSG